MMKKIIGIFNGFMNSLIAGIMAIGGYWLFGSALSEVFAINIIFRFLGFLFIVAGIGISTAIGYAFSAFVLDDEVIDNEH